MKKYPEDFRNSTDFSNVGNEEINLRIEDGFKQLEKNNSPYHIGFSGDTMIMIMRLHEEDGGGFEIIVSKDYHQSYYKNKIFK